MCGYLTSEILFPSVNRTNFVVLLGGLHEILHTKHESWFVYTVYELHKYHCCGLMFPKSEIIQSFYSCLFSNLSFSASLWFYKEKFSFKSLPVSLCKLKFSEKEIAYLLNCEISPNLIATDFLNAVLVMVLLLSKCKYFTALSPCNWCVGVKLAFLVNHP